MDKHYDYDYNDNDNDYDNDIKYPKYMKYNILIDSINRNKYPTTIEDNNITLNSNNININKNVMEIIIGKNHLYKENDQISIRNILYVQKTIKIYSSYVSSGNIIDKYAIDIVRSLDDNTKSFMRFDVDPNINVNAINALTSTGFSQSKAFFLGSSEDNLKYKEYDITFNDMFVSISGFNYDSESCESGESGESCEIDGINGINGINGIGGIPINFINNTHRMYLSPREISRGNNPVQLGIRIKGITDTFDHSDNNTIRSFYIKLPKEFKLNQLKKSQNNIKITFYHYGGIPINQLNAFYPITQNNINGYHIVDKVFNTKIQVNLNRNGYYINSFGNKSCISKLIGVTHGNINSNNYSIALNDIYYNVVSAQIINPIFPDNSQLSNITNNNKLYWINEDEGYEYNIELEHGNYTYDILKTQIEEKIYNTNRKIKNPKFTNKQYIKLSINQNNDSVRFESYNEAKIIKPFVTIEPNIETTEEYNSILYDGIFNITINFDGHNIKIGDKIIINGAINTLGIPATILNATHYITSITSSTFTFSINGVNLDDIRRNTRGGNNVTIYIPNKISLRFNHNDTIGDILGFRNCSDPMSITPYSTIITNDDKYINELDIDPSGNNIYIKRNKLILNSINDYLIMSCHELNQNQNININMFQRIILNKNKNNVKYNKIIYREPIRELKTLNFKYYTPNGNLIEFNNYEHSFIIQIITYYM